MKCKCPHCNEEINLSIFLNRQVKRKDTDPEELQIIAEIVCHNSGIDLDEFRKADRSRILAKARQQYMWLASKYTSHQKTQIAKFVRPEMNHSTVIHGIGLINDLIETSSQDKLEMEFLIDKVEERLLKKQMAV